MSSWAGIESTPSPAADPGGRGALAGAHPAIGTEYAHQWRPRRQPRPVLGSLDTAGAMVQGNVREIVVGSAWILLPGVVVGLVATSLAFDRYQSFQGAAVSVPELLGGAKAETGVEELLWFVGLVVSSLAACLVGGFASTLVVQRRAGRPMRVAAAYRALVPRLPALSLAWLLGHAWFPLAILLLGNVEGSARTVLAVLASPLILVAVTCTLVAAPAIVIEGLGPVGGLRRS